MKPFLSIIIPVYNVEKYIDRCLKSFYYQKGEIELIAVDDGSTDDSGKILDDWLKKEKRLRVYHKENGGVSSARNFGLEKAQSENITFIDPDDFVSESYCLVCEQLINKGAELTCFNMYHQTGDKKDYTTKKFQVNDGLHTNIKDFYKYLFDYYNYFDSPVNKIYKKWIIEKFNIRFRVGMRVSEDKNFNLDYLQVIKSIYISSTPLYYYFYNPSGALRKRTLSYLDDYDYVFNKKKNIMLKYNIKYNIDNLYNIFLDKIFLNFDNFIKNNISIKEIHNKLLDISLTKEILNHKYPRKLQKLQQLRLKNLVNGHYFTFKILSKLYNLGIKLKKK